MTTVTVSNLTADVILVTLPSGETISASSAGVTVSTGGNNVAVQAQQPVPTLRAIASAPSAPAADLGMVVAAAPVVAAPASVPPAIVVPDVVAAAPTVVVSA